MKNFINRIRRFVNGLKRPSKQINMTKLRQRGESLDSFTFRDAIVNDVPKPGELHAKNLG